MKIFHVTIFAFFLLIGCQSKKPKEIIMLNNKRAIHNFEFLANTFVVVKVSVEDIGTFRFLLDTGAGLDVISTRLCKKLNCKEHGSFTGKRMRGEEVTIGLTKLKSLKFENFERKDWEVGTTNLFDEIPKELGPLDGALSLKFFQDHAFTLDFPNKKVIVESVNSLKTRYEQGTSVAVTPFSQKPKALVYLLDMNNFGEKGAFEVDTGNLTTILPKKHLKRLNIDLKAPNVKIVKNKQMDRVYSKANGEINVFNASRVTQINPLICFQDIIYDGVIGVDFFKNKVATFDLLNSKIVFRATQASSKK